MSGPARRPRRPAVLVAALLAACAEAQGAGDLKTVRDGLEAYDQAVACARTDAARAKGLYQTAASCFESLLAGGARNAALYYNLANTRFRLGDLGRAVLNYRRAETLAPADARVAANLKYARDRVEPFITPSAQRQLLDRLLFWNRYTSTTRRLWIAAWAGALGWLALALRLRWKSAALTAGACLLIAVGFANSASVAWQLHQDAREPAAVIVNGPVTLRLARGEGADPALAQPLGPGVEVRILEERGDWCEVRLVDDKRGWVPANALERV